VRFRAPPDSNTADHHYFLKQNLSVYKGTRNGMVGEAYSSKFFGLVSYGLYFT
jgi:hypothetical protein